MGQVSKSHLIHYLILFLFLGLGLWGFSYFSYDRDLQRLIIILVAVAYLSWGIVHHYLEESLNPKIVIEYTSWAALAAALLLIIVGVSS